jgi:Glu-tRNA(Gln) amidotransferase subunit E-like FAD-binding protein
MKKIILFTSMLILMCSCSTRPVLESKEYKVIDTLKIRYSNFGRVDGADVIIKYDSTYHYGFIDRYGKLIEMNPKNLKVEKIK